MSAGYWTAFWPPPGPHAKPQDLAVHHKPHHTPERVEERARRHQTSRVASSRQQAAAGGPKTRTYSRLHSRHARRIETIHMYSIQCQITKTSRSRRGSLVRRARKRETHGLRIKSEGRSLLLSPAIPFLKPLVCDRRPLLALHTRKARSLFPLPIRSAGAHNYRAHSRPCPTRDSSCVPRWRQSTKHTGPRQPLTTHRRATPTAQTNLPTNHRNS